MRLASFIALGQTFGRTIGAAAVATYKTHPMHDVVECPICQNGETAKCPDYRLAYGDRQC